MKIKKGLLILILNFIYWVLLTSPISAVENCGIKVENGNSFKPNQSIETTLINFKNTYLTGTTFLQLYSNAGTEVAKITIDSGNYNKKIVINLASVRSISDGLYSLAVKNTNALSLSTLLCKDTINNICISLSGTCASLPPAAITHTYLTKECDFCGRCKVVNPLQPTPISYQQPPKYAECQACIEGTLLPLRGTSAPELGSYTALGCIPTSPDGFATWFLNKIMLVLGGIALMVMFFGVFTIISSAGVPEKLNEGKDMITASFAGIIFILFSILMLKVVGYDIFKLPDFNLP